MTKHIAVFIITLLYLSPAFGQDIADNLKLKCDKDKILFSKETTTNNFNKKTGKFEHTTFVAYKYLTNTIVDKQKFGKFDEDVSKRTNNSLHFSLGGNKWHSVFYNDDEWIETSKDEWLAVDWATTTPEAFKEQTKDTIGNRLERLGWLYADTTSVFYPGAGDGYAQRYSIISFNNARTGAGTGADYTSITGDVGYGFIGALGNDYILYRAFFPFNTVALPDSITISAATLKVRVSSVDLWGDDVGLVLTSQASGTELVTADYDNLTVNSPTLGAPRVAIDDTSLKWYTWTLDATGRSWISTTGWTKFALRGEDDIDNAYEDDVFIHLCTVEKTGTTSDPYLSVTYSTGEAGRRMFMVQ